MSPAAPPVTTTVCFSFFPQTPLIADTSAFARLPMNSTTQPAGSPSVTATFAPLMLLKARKAVCKSAEVMS